MDPQDKKIEEYPEKHYVYILTSYSDGNFYSRGNLFYKKYNLIVIRDFSLTRGYRMFTWYPIYTRKTNPYSTLYLLNLFLFSLTSLCWAEIDLILSDIFLHLKPRVMDSSGDTIGLRLQLLESDFYCGPSQSQFSQKFKKISVTYWYCRKIRRKLKIDRKGRKVKGLVKW